MFASLPSYGLQPTRLLYPWDSPGKNTRVGCYFLLQGIFLTEGSNLHLLCLLHWQPDSYTLDQKKSPLFPFEPWDPQRIHHAATLLLWLCRSPWIMSPPGEPFWSKSLLTQVKNQPHSRVRSGFPGDLVVKESACQCTSCGRCSFHPWVRKILLERK